MVDENGRCERLRLTGAGKGKLRVESEELRVGIWEEGEGWR